MRRQGIALPPGGLFAPSLLTLGVNFIVRLGVFVIILYLRLLEAINPDWCRGAINDQDAPQKTTRSTTCIFMMQVEWIICSL